MRQLKHDESGQALVEFALMLPALLILTFATVYLVDLVRARLKNHEVARYAAFAMAKQGLSNYDTGTHDSKIQNAKRVVQAETHKLYEDFDSAATYRPNQGAVLVGALADVVINTEDIPVLPSASIKEALDAIGAPSVVTFIVELILGVANSAVLSTVGRLGFNTHGWAEARAHSSWRNVLLPDALTWLFSTNMFPEGPNVKNRVAQGTRLQHFMLDDSVALMTDPWVLPDGRDVRTPGKIGIGSKKTDEDALLRKQVSRMFMFKGALLPAEMQGALDAVFSAAGMVGLNPFAVRTTSLNYILQNPDTGRSDPFDAAGANGVSGEVKRFDTIHMQDGRHPAPNVQALQGRGPYYMGCKQAQRSRCDFDQ